MPDLAPPAIASRAVTRLLGAAWTNSLLTILLAAAGAYGVLVVAQWAVLEAQFAPDAQACRSAAGACWGAIVDRGHLVFLGRFPASEAWRPILAATILAGAVLLAATPRLAGGAGLALVVLGLAIFAATMDGSLFGLDAVASDLWGGLPLTIFLATCACLVGIPLGTVLAIGRRSEHAAVRIASTAYIEGIRGIPLITLLFFGAFVLPLLLPPSLRIDMAFRIVVCLVAFEAAYFAEVIRGGLQSIPRGQVEAARALGLGRFRTLYDVVLPQAFRVVIGPTVNNVIGVVKNTSLVAVVNVYDLSGSLKLAASDPTWKIYFVEFYLTVSLVYLALGIVLSAYGRWIERRFGVTSPRPNAAAGLAK